MRWCQHWLSSYCILSALTLLIRSQIKVEKEQKLTLHQANLLQRKDGSVASPVLVLGRRIIQVFGGDDEGGEEHTMPCRLHAMGNLGQTSAQTFE